MDTKSRTFSVYYPKTRPEAPPDYTMVASMNANYDDWADLDAEAYQQAKEAMIERCFVDLERYIPGIRAKVDTVEAATPRTFHRYTLHTRGLFGTKFEGLDISRTLHKEIAGLFHVGSVGIIMSGWLGAINYGVIVANDVDELSAGLGIAAAIVGPTVLPSLHENDIRCLTFKGKKAVVTGATRGIGRAISRGAARARGPGGRRLWRQPAGGRGHGRRLRPHSATGCACTSSTSATLLRPCRFFSATGGPTGTPWTSWSTTPASAGTRCWP